MEGISVFHAVIRVYTKARAHIYKEWDDTVTDDFVAQGSARSALDPIWRAAVRAEAATGQQQAAATMALDIAAFFESIDWGLLRGRALAAGLPEPLVDTALALYALPRYISGDGVVERAQYPTRGVAP